MSDTFYRVRELDASIDRKSFSSGSVALGQYFQQQVTQGLRRRVTACFVAMTEDKRVAGYYTLATTGLRLTDLPAEMAKNYRAIQLCQQCEWAAWLSIRLSRDRG